MHRNGIGKFHGVAVVVERAPLSAAFVEPQEAIQSKSVVLVVGSGVTAFSSAGAATATWRGFSEPGIDFALRGHATHEWADTRQDLWNTGFRRMRDRI